MLKINNKKTGKIRKEKKEIKNSKRINYFCVNFTILAVILIIIFSVCLAPRKLQNDTFYTIKIGELISNNGIDMKDHFSWHENLKYTYPHWLYDYLTFQIYDVFGFQGIYITTCILSAVLGVSMFFVISKLTKNKSLSFIVTILSMYLLEDYIAARAQLVTFILFIWTVYFIEKFLETKKIRYAIALIIIPIAIANLHVAVWPFYFVLYLPYIAEYIIADLAETIFYKQLSMDFIKIRIKFLQKKAKNAKKVESLKEKLEAIQEKSSRIKIKREEELQNPYKIILKKNPNVKWLILIMVICAFTGLLTPLKDTPYTYLINTMNGNTIKNINEHLPLTLANNTQAMIMLFVFLLITIFTKTKLRLSDWFMLAGLTYLMFKTRRQISMFVLICSIIFTRLIVDLIKTYTKNGLEVAEEVSKNIAVCVSLTVLMLLVSYEVIKPKLDDPFVNEKSYPVKASDYILENIDLSKARLYNEYNYGSYLLFRGIPVFIDSRADLYSPEFSGNKNEDIFTDFVETSSIGKFYEDTFKKYKITHVITYKNSKTNMIITKTNDKNYKELYSDDNFVLYERLNAEE